MRAMSNFNKCSVSFILFTLLYSSSGFSRIEIDKKDTEDFNRLLEIYDEQLIGCSNSAANVRKKIDEVLEKHPNWNGHEVSHGEASFDLTTYEQLKKNYAKNCK